MNWKAIKRFNFTYAIPDGAWLEDDKGYVNWHAYKEIVTHLGSVWWERMRQKQGWMTGCWVSCDN